MQLFRALRVIAGRARRAAVDGPRSRLRRPRPRAAPASRSCSTRPRTSGGPSSSRSSGSPDRQVPHLLGVREVPGRAAEEAWWHRGRCLSYGEGVAYWALAEMVRMRCGITEDEEVALGARQATRDPRGSTSPTPRSEAGSSRGSAHLLGLEEGVAGDQENLFSAWRVLFERLAEIDPVVLVFEDMQWADAGLLDFLDYLLDWSRNHPIFVLSLARPELAEKHPSWGAGKRAVDVALPRAAPAAGDGGACSPASSRACPRSCARRSSSRAEGIPLYAVETVRMLLDRGAARPGRGRFQRDRADRDTRGAGNAARARRRAARRSLAQRSGGSSRARPCSARRSRSRASPRSPGLRTTSSRRCSRRSCARRCSSIQADPRSPERGQYAFLQDIVKHVAYETLSKRERKDKHLAAARVPRDALGRRGGRDRRGRRCALPRRVGRGARGRGRGRDQGHCARDAGPCCRARLVARRHRRGPAGLRACDRAHRRRRRPGRAARARGDRGDGRCSRRGCDSPLRGRDRAVRGRGRDPSGRTRVSPGGPRSCGSGGSSRTPSRAWSVRSRCSPRTSRTRHSPRSLRSSDASSSSPARSRSRAERIETALDLAEALLLPEVFSQALNTKAMMLLARPAVSRRRPSSSATRSRSLSRPGKPSAALRAYNNYHDLLDAGRPVRGGAIRSSPRDRVRAQARQPSVGTDACSVRSTPPSPSASGTRRSSSAAG